MLAEATHGGMHVCKLKLIQQIPTLGTNESVLIMGIASFYGHVLWSTHWDI